jgi:hypothetical protein
MVAPPAINIETMSIEQIEDIVNFAVPNAAAQIMEEVRYDNADLKPVTKLMTLIGDFGDETSSAIIEALIAQGDEKAPQKIGFIIAFQAIDYDVFMVIMSTVCGFGHNNGNEQLYQHNFDSLWNIIVDHNHDGALFLETVSNGLFDPDDETAEMFLSYYGI